MSHYLTLNCVHAEIQINFGNLIVSFAFLDTRYIIKIFIHALLIKSELNCC